MAQASDNTVDNGTGAAVRSDINSRLAALYTNHSGTTDTTMVTKYPYQTWADTTANQLKLRNAANDGWITLRGLDGSVISAGGTAAAPGISFAGTSNAGIFSDGSGSIGFSIGGTRYMEIVDVGDGSGNESLLWKTTSNPISNNVSGIQFTHTGRINIGNFENCLVLNRHTSTGTIVGIRYSTNNVGSITVTASSTSYNTSSDYRLKENVVALTGAKTRLNSLNVKRFNFTIDPSVTVDGFLAHEVAPIVPEAISGTKDEVDSDGNPVYQGIDQAKLVPLLTAALQEAFAEIAALTARVEALEAA
jgi:hypothetical protein